MPRKFLVDTAPLRESRDFRWLFIGSLVGMIGAQLTLVAIPYQIYEATRSSLQVGAVSLAGFVPLILGALVGGAVGDAVDRRFLMLVTSAGLGVTSAGLALNSLGRHPHPSVILIYVISAIAAGLTGFVTTARNAAIPTLLEERRLVAANSFMQMTFQVGTVIGPAFGGLLIELVGVPWVYAIDAVTYALTIWTVLLMAPIPPPEGATRPGVGAIVDGVRYLRGRAPLQGAYVIDINAMVFGMPRALFPAMTATIFHGGAGTLGLLYAAPGAGAVVGAVTTGWVDHVRRQGVTVIASVIVWGAAVTAFGFARGLVVAMLLLAVAGWADVISAVLRNTMIQTVTSEEYRSRMSAFQMAVVQGGPRLGDLESGAVASAFSTQVSIVSGGLACVAGAGILATLLPAFRRYHVETEKP